MTPPATPSSSASGSASGSQRSPALDDASTVGATQARVPEAGGILHREPASPAAESPEGVNGVARGQLKLAQSEHARPSAWARVTAVWMRHWTVYKSTLLANSLPAFAEPVLFLAAIGIGLGQYIETDIGGLPFGAWMGSGVLAMTAMFTATFETTFGTFVRMVYQKTYAAMIVTPVTVRDAFVGELLWCGTKGFAFTLVVLGVFLVFGAFSNWLPALTWTVVFLPIIGFIAAFLFGALGMIVTARIQNLNNFNFFFTGVITPMTFFSGMLFPVSELPLGLEYVAYVLPLFHITEINRYLLFGYQEGRIVEWLWVCPLYLGVMTPLLTWYAIRSIRKRVQA